MKNRKNIITIIPAEVLANRIYLLRGEKVMLDRDLAELYGVIPIRLREQVRRNMQKFPSNFMFKLNKSEVKMLVAQQVIPSMRHLGGTLPYAFSEHGVLMLANILKSERAIKVSIKIIELFVMLRENILADKELRLEIEKIKKQLNNHDENLKFVLTLLDELLTKKTTPRKSIGFKYTIPKKKLKNH